MSKIPARELQPGRLFQAVGRTSPSLCNDRTFICKGTDAGGRVRAESYKSALPLTIDPDTQVMAYGTYVRP